MQRKPLPEPGIAIRAWFGHRQDVVANPQTMPAALDTRIGPPSHWDNLKSG
jgi:hypothetical protein